MSLVYTEYSKLVELDLIKTYVAGNQIRLNQYAGIVNNHLSDSSGDSTSLHTITRALLFSYEGLAFWCR